ncbi:MAG: Hsp33 family molecular chaperone HslO [Gammaproteobacteria bacterium]|nr:Hsp33 family molecular chaperone HslO [Gammaproteobacteria bacterium]
MEGDSLQRFAFEAFAVRGQLVHLNASWRAVLERHVYPPAVQPVLAQALAASVMLSSMLKSDGRVTLQVQGDGPLNLLVAQCTHQLQVRGLARWQADVSQGDFHEQVGDGRLAITVHNEARPEPYQGIVPLDGVTLGHCLESYFSASEQLATRFWFFANQDSVSGLLLQRMPEADPDSDDWQRVQLMAETISGQELSTLSNRALLKRLFNEDDIRVFEPGPISFRCSCNTKRIESMLRAMGSAELESILQEKGAVSVSCEFCNRAQSFDPVDIARILEGKSETGGSASLH